MYTGIGIERDNYLPKAAQTRSTDARRGNTGGALAQHVKQLAEQADNDQQALANAWVDRYQTHGVVEQAGWTGADCGKPEARNRCDWTGPTNADRLASGLDLPDASGGGIGRPNIGGMGTSYVSRDYTNYWPGTHKRDYRFDVQLAGLSME